MFRSSFYAAPIAAALLALGGAAQAQNAAFQNFFSSVCQGNPQGALAVRCLESGPPGEIGGASESSQNPSQFLGSEAASANQRLEEIRDGETEDDRISGLGLFAHGRYSWFERDTTANERGLDGDSKGIQVGADYRFSNRLVAGILFGYDRIESDFADLGGDTESDAYSVTVFANFNVTDRLWIEGSALAGIDRFDTTRRFLFTPNLAAEQTFVATSDTDGTRYSASIGAGYDFDSGPFSFGPYARLTYLGTQVDGFTESGSSGLELTLQDNTTDSLRSSLGVRGSYALSQPWGVLVPQARLQWEHEFIDEAQAGLASFALDPTGQRLVVPGDQPDSNFFLLGLGASLILPNGWMPFVDYEALLGHDFLERHIITVGLRVEL